MIDDREQTHRPKCTLPSSIGAYANLVLDIGGLAILCDWGDNRGFGSNKGSLGQRRVARRPQSISSSVISQSRWHKWQKT